VVCVGWEAGALFFLCHPPTPWPSAACCHRFVAVQPARSGCMLGLARAGVVHGMGWSGHALRCTPPHTRTYTRPVVLGAQELCGVAASWFALCLILVAEHAERRRAACDRVVCAGALPPASSLNPLSLFPATYRPVSKRAPAGLTGPALPSGNAELRQQKNTPALARPSAAGPGAADGTMPTSTPAPATLAPGALVSTAAAAVPAVFVPATTGLHTLAHLACTQRAA